MNYNMRKQLEAFEQELEELRRCKAELEEGHTALCRLKYPASTGALIPYYTKLIEGKIKHYERLLAMLPREA